VVNPSQTHTDHCQGYSILPKEGMFCKVIERGEVKIGDFVTVIEDHREN
jgi:MOSC domain-containing protein YiiM